jgi:hypothetical protein
MKVFLLALVALLVSSSAYAQSSAPQGTPDSTSGTTNVGAGIAGPSTGEPDTDVDPTDDHK